MYFYFYFGIDKISHIEYIEKIQENSFYSELPEFNMKKIIGTNRIIHLEMGFDKFLNDYLNDNGKQFIELINKYEIEREKEENPF